MSNPKHIFNNNSNFHICASCALCNKRNVKKKEEKKSEIKFIHKNSLKASAWNFFGLMIHICTAAEMRGKENTHLRDKSA